MSMVGFPLLLIPLAIYNIIVFLMPGVSLAEPIFKLTLVSGAEWPLTLSDMLLALGIIMLLLEVIKGARPGAKFLTDHLLSLIIFGAAAAEFLLWPRFANSTYFLLALLTLVDFLTGITLRVRRGTQKASAVPRQVRELTPVAAPAARVEPKLADPEPHAPVVTPAAESRPPQHSDGLSAPPEARPSSEVASPELQPDHGVQRPPGPAPHQDPDLK
ncbi:MAG: hypothetical protein WA820_20750 [Bradyrhizobium sp.]